MSASTLSPCIRVCVLDHSTGRCRGCMRLLEEIAGWSQFTPAQRKAVMERIQRARAAGPIDS